MAVYKLNSEKQKSEKKRDTKKIVGFSLIGSASVIFLLMTGIFKPLQTFFLGVLGVFGYPLCIILLIVGLALLNNRKYVMSLRYTICLILSVIFLLCILQLAVVGGKNGNFWQYLASNYTKTWTPGGFLIGILTTIFLYVANSYGAYVICSLAFLLCLALLLDSIRVMKKTISANEPVSVKIMGQKGEKTEKFEEVNVVLDGNIKEQEREEKRQLTAKEILGLDKKQDKAYGFEEPQIEEKKVEIEPQTPQSLKKLILTPPQINIDEYFKDLNKKNVAPEQSEVQKNVSILKDEKQENIAPQFAREQTFEDDNDDFEIDETARFEKADDLVERANDILKEAIEEEKSENPDIYENAQEEPQNPERNLLNRLPERDNSGNFERNFDRPNFARPGDRITRQDDMDARADFNRNFDSIRERNGSLSREQQPIAPEEPPKPIEPYVYTKPSLDFITTQSVDLSTLNEDVALKRVLLENCLETFGIPAKVQGVVVGPAVTRYELEMPQGIPVGKIKNRSDDIALALAAEGAIRIEAPVPGTSVVGIEVPNSTIATISLKDVLASREFQEARSPLTFALGKDITGRIICCNMQKLTHLLVAGATGSGKSVCLNSIILSIVYKASPEDVKIILIDPKRVEFSNYEALPHLIMPEIVCDSQKAADTLAWAVDEMEKRFDMLQNARVKNIDEYNTTQDVLDGKVKKMPFIVIIVDELADLMMTARKEVEEKVCRLAQKARAAGIHLILATQRPSVDVITGLIKANFPSRISFALTSAVDSSTILDRVGAEKLLGKGDMLYFPNGAKDPQRVQGCFISTNEINDIVDFVRDNNKPIFDPAIEEAINNPNKNGPNNTGFNNEMEPLLPQVLKFAIECGSISVTMVRRRFAVGYSKAARIVDQMEEAGYISAADGPKGRTVYITEDEYNDIFG